MHSRACVQVVTVCIAALSTGCGGRVDPSTQGTGEGVSSGPAPGASESAGPTDASAAFPGSSGGAGQANTTSSSAASGTVAPGVTGGGPGQGSTSVADCSAMSPPNVIRICPDGSQGFASYVSVAGVCTLAYACPSRPNGWDCAPQAACTLPGDTCYIPSSVEDAGSISCVCDSTGHLGLRAAAVAGGLGRMQSRRCLPDIAGMLGRRMFGRPVRLRVGHGVCERRTLVLRKLRVRQHGSHGVRIELR